MLYNVILRTDILQLAVLLSSFFNNKDRVFFQKNLVFSNKTCADQ